jgi:hypothetical protein
MADASAFDNTVNTAVSDRDAIHASRMTRD